MSIIDFRKLRNASNQNVSVPWMVWWVWKMSTQDFGATCQTVLSTTINKHLIFWKNAVQPSSRVLHTWRIYDKMCWRCAWWNNALLRHLMLFSFHLSPTCSSFQKMRKCFTEREKSRNREPRWFVVKVKSRPTFRQYWIYKCLDLSDV